jgi:hypothetical protein
MRLICGWRGVHQWVVSDKRLICGWRGVHQLVVSDKINLKRIHSLFGKCLNLSFSSSVNGTMNNKKYKKFER